MKELSIEEKARAYDEAIERAKEIHNEQCAQPFNVMLKVFPELKESEEERIINLLKMVVEKWHNVGYTDYVMDMPKSEILAWLEKQGETSPILSNSPNIGKAEQKPDDKDEPKFNVGDWVIDNYGIVKQILSYKDGVYRHTNGYSAKIFEKWWRMWTIKDAKDGDVLIYGKYKRPFIFKGLLDKFHPENPVAYCGIDDSDVFVINSGDAWWTCEEVQPSAKEQRDLLFQKMKEAGYEWVTSKKELKEIEQKSSWNEEDEKFFKTALWHISYSISNGKHTDIHCDTTDWFKSLKERLQHQTQWRPSDAQMASITCAVRKMKESACYDSELVSLLEDLKKLKG